MVCVCGGVGRTFPVAVEPFKMRCLDPFGRLVHFVNFLRASTHLRCREYAYQHILSSVGFKKKNHQAKIAVFSILVNVSF